MRKRTSRRDEKELFMDEHRLMIERDACRYLTRDIEKKNPAT